jgi:hypothetical protein
MLFWILAMFALSGCAVRWMDSAGHDRSLGTTRVAWERSAGGVQRDELSLGLIIDLVDKHVSVGLRQLQSVYPRELGAVTYSSVIAQWYGEGERAAPVRTVRWLAAGNAPGGWPVYRQSSVYGLAAESSPADGHFGLGVFQFREFINISTERPVLILKRADGTREAYAWDSQGDRP